MKKRIIIAAAAGLLAVGCAHDPFGGRGIRFQAQSTGYMDLPTKTEYSGVKTGSVERIDWTDGDLIRIVSDKAYVLDDPERKWSDFRVDSHEAKSGDAAICRATIMPSSDPNSLQWSNGEHTFWAMYPSPETSGVPDGTALAADGTMSFTIPATQTVTQLSGTRTWLPDMKLAPMMAKNTVAANSSSVPLLFSPQYTAYQFTVSKSVGLSKVTLASFTLERRTDDESYSGSLAGSFTASAPGTVSISGSATQSITVDLDGIVLDNTTPTFTFTVFALPQEVKGLRITFTGDYTGKDNPTPADLTQTRKLTLKDGDDNAITFAPFLKYKITGMILPEIIDATIEDSIIWDHSVSIMDSYIWWVDTGLDYTEWVADVDSGIRYAYLRDLFAWWVPSAIADDFTWEEAAGIELHDPADPTAPGDSDMYLWVKEKNSRTVNLVNFDGQTYSDADVVWSVIQTEKVLSINSTNGEVTARTPGEATVIATVTPNCGGDPWVASYKVYVNAPTAITLTAAKDFVKPYGTVELTANVTFTANGTLTDEMIPSDLLTWTSASTDYITLSGAVTQPTAAGVATATSNGVAEGSSTITVTVDSEYANNLSATLTDFPCDDRADLTFPNGGEPYKFRGLYMHPGVLFWDGTSFSITDGRDPMELLQHYYYDSRTTKFGEEEPGTGTAWVNCCYFTWTQLISTERGLGDGTNITAKLSANDLATGNHDDWGIATYDEWKAIKDDSPQSPLTIQINDSDPVSDNSRNYICVNVNLSSSDIYKNKGLGYQNNTTDDMAGNKEYQNGILLVPDGALITCTGITAPNHGSSNGTEASETINVIDYNDLLILVHKGCVFLPISGYARYYTNATWAQGGSYGYHWTSQLLKENDVYTTFNNATAIQLGHIDGYLSVYCYPVRLVRVDD